MDSIIQRNFNSYGIKEKNWHVFIKRGVLSYIRNNQWLQIMLLAQDIAYLSET
jgi:hypothetical protein